MAAVAVVGGGIVGCAVAVWLLDEGHDVTVFAIDPFEGRLAIYDPSLSFIVI